MVSITARAGGRSSTIQAKRPLFSELWKYYPVKMSASDVYSMVGGQAMALYQENPTGYANACALRLSRSFNYGGMPIKQSTRGYKVRGADHKPYLLRVREMITFVEQSLGNADLSFKPQNNQDLSLQLKEKKRNYYFQSLWLGRCFWTCHFMEWK